MTHSADLDTVPFQFTPLREGRPDSPERIERTAYFNSRPSARGDAGSKFFSRKH